MDCCLKTKLTDDDCQCLADKLNYYINEKYKDQIGEIPDHIKHTLCQNYILQLKNNNLDLDNLLGHLGI